MEGYLSATNAVAGLLLYKDMNSQSFERLNSLNQYIFIMSVDLLINVLDRKTLSELLLELKRQRLEQVS